MLGLVQPFNDIADLRLLMIRHVKEALQPRPLRLSVLENA